MLGTNAVDLVDLDRANALFRFEAADVGQRIAGDEALHEEFRYQAVDFWCDAGPIIRAHYDDVLDGSGEPLPRRLSEKSTESIDGGDSH